MLCKPTCKSSYASNEYITRKSYLQWDKSSMVWTMLPVCHAWIFQGRFCECRFFYATKFLITSMWPFYVNQNLWNYIRFSELYMCYSWHACWLPKVYLAQGLNQEPLPPNASLKTLRLSRRTWRLNFPTCTCDIAGIHAGHQSLPHRVWILEFCQKMPVSIPLDQRFVCLFQG